MDDRFPEDFKRFMCSHLIPLVWWVDVPDGESGTRIEPQAATCFLVTIRGIPMLVTAGHVVTRIRKQIDAGIHPKQARLFDQWKTSHENQGIPFALEDAALYSHECHGADIGLISLRPYYAELLNVGETQPVSEEAWAVCPSDLEGWLLVGFPEESRRTQSLTAELSEFTIWPEVLPLRSTEGPVEWERNAPGRLYFNPDRFVGTHDGRQVHLTTLKGMSGGPIIGYKRLGTGEMRYWVIGVQSTEGNGAEVVSVVPLQTLLSELGTYFDEWVPVSTCD